MKILIPSLSQNKVSLLSYVMMTLGALFYTIGIQVFLQPAGLFSTGMGAFASLFTYTIKNLKDYFSLIYLALNLPLMIYFWNKISKKFIYRTLYFLIIQAAFGVLFVVPEIREIFENIFEGFKDPKTKTFNNGTATGWPILVMALFAGIICGFSIAITWKYGGSSGGTDIIVYYYSTKQKKSIGRMAFIVATIIVLFSFSLTVILKEGRRNLWYLIILSTFVYSILISWIIDKVFPKYSKVKISIHSDYPDIIKDFLLSSKFTHAFHLTKVTSGYNNKERIMIESVILLLELKSLVRQLREIDENIWISIKKVHGVYGNFITTSVDE